MTRYLKVQVDGPYIGDDVTLYSELDDSEHTEEQLLQIGQDMVNERYSWGHEVVDAEDVPDKERTDG